MYEGMSPSIHCETKDTHCVTLTGEVKVCKVKKETAEVNSCSATLTVKKHMNCGS